MSSATQHPPTSIALRNDTRNRCWRHVCRSQSGQATVEFALIIPIVVLILFGIAYFGIALNDWIDETHIASTGARFAEVNENCIVKGSPHTCELGVREEGPFLKWLTEQGDNSQIKNAVATMCSPTSKLGDYVEVKLTYKYKWVPVLKLKVAETPLTSTARMRIEQEPYVPYPAC
jgi:hypothetical protein